MRKQLFQIVAAAAILAGAAGAATPGQNRKFVTRLYQDLLDRRPSRTESVTLEGLLNLGATRTQIAGLITSGKEYRTDRIQQYFNDFLNRPADAGAVNFYLNYLQQGAAGDDVKAAILGSDEYYRKAGGTIPGFLNALYQDVLGRPLDPAGLATFQAMLANGATRQAVAEAVLHSLEADQLEIKQFYQKFLHRAPQPAELNTMAQMLQTGATEEFVIDLICGSEEYFQLAQ